MAGFLRSPKIELIDANQGRGFKDIYTYIYTYIYIYIYVGGMSAHVEPETSGCRWTDREPLGVRDLNSLAAISESFDVPSKGQTVRKPTWKWLLVHQAALVSRPAVPFPTEWPF